MAKPLVFGEPVAAARLAGDATDVARRRSRRATARDVAIAPVADPARRERCRLDLRAFCELYLPDLFTLAWSPDHLTIIARLADCILYGRRYCLAAARGTGKSTLVIAACLWAILYGHRSFVVILGATHEDSKARLESIRLLIETCDAIHADFPGPCSCVRALEGAWNRSNAQTVAGERTHIKWGGTFLSVFPMIDGEPSSGAVVATRSMDSSIRGIQHTKPDGTIIRPDLVLLDDPQTPEQAASEFQVNKLENRIKGDVLNLAGPNVSLAAFMLITVIAEDDIAMRFLDHQRHPTWRGQRFQLIYKPPTNQGLWERYDVIRQTSLDKHGDERLAAEFYAAHREAMDEGAEVAWTERYRPERGEISAVQFAMNELFDLGPAVFRAEYQNEPPPREDLAALVLDAYRVETKSSGLARGAVPENALSLVSGWDVGKFGIYWIVAAVGPHRVVSIIDYGMQEIDAPTGRIDPADMARTQALEIAILNGCRRLHDKFTADPYVCPATGEAHEVDLTLIDAGYQAVAVHKFCSEDPARLGAVRGCGTARHQPNFYIPRKTLITHDGNLYLKPDASGRRVHYANVDVYKEQVQGGFILEPDAPGSLALFEPEHRRTHHSIARHITAEIQTEVDPGVFKWTKARGRPDNHWLDATGYALACISILEHSRPLLAVDSPELEEPEEPDDTPQPRKQRQRRDPPPRRQNARRAAKPPRSRPRNANARNRDSGRESRPWINAPGRKPWI